MKRWIVLGLSACAALSAGLARADGAPPTPAGRVDKATCLTAVTSGQRLRDTHKLVAAREQFRVCGRSECPAVVRSDCASWLAELDKTLPTVVLSAKDGAGRYVVDVRVSVDGQPLVGKLNGQAVAVDLGLHTFRFERLDDASKVATQQALVKEGEKAQSVSVVLSEAGSAAPPPSSSADAASDGSARPATTPPPSTSTPGSTFRLLGLVLGGAGVVGMGVGTGIALDAKSKDNRAANETGTAQKNDSVSAVNEGNVATVVLVVGAAMAAAGVVLWLTAPSATTGGPAESATNLALATDGREVILRGTF
jgi:hypothetical protein